MKSSGIVPTFVAALGAVVMVSAAPAMAHDGSRDTVPSNRASCDAERPERVRGERSDVSRRETTRDRVQEGRRERPDARSTERAGNGRRDRSIHRGRNNGNAGQNRPQNQTGSDTSPRTHDDNGHGNDPGGYDSSNPGNSTGAPGRGAAKVSHASRGRR